MSEKKQETGLSGNAAFIASLDKIKTPIKALETLAANSEYLGSDPYYRELDAALWRMVDRVLARHGKAGR